MSGKRWRRYTKKVGCLVKSVARDSTEIDRRQSKINWSFELQHQDSRGPSKGGEDNTCDKSGVINNIHYALPPPLIEASMISCPTS